ncbi:hypothetical protein SJ301_29790, partial [Klebsiella pneumoniae]|uniref:hypothetical protein n=1 Tax=Klebsiella pneumoniae TaxID=573 RepID=UPI0029D76059
VNKPTAPGFLHQSLSLLRTDSTHYVNINRFSGLRQIPARADRSSVPARLTDVSTQAKAGFIKHERKLAEALYCPYSGYHLLLT